jgi:hypothetical protein
MKVTKEQREEALAELRQIIQPGDTVYVSQVSVSRSGMQRTVKVFIPVPTSRRYSRDTGWVESDRPGIRNITWLVARALGYTLRDRDPEWLIRLDGAGMDMHFHLVYSLSRTLFADDPFHGAADGREDPGYLLTKESL